MRKLFDLVALICLINPIAISLAAGDLTPLYNHFFLKYAQDSDTSSQSLLVVYSFIFLFAGIYLLKNYLRLPGIVMEYKIPFLIGVIAITSTTWSMDKVQVFKDAAFFFGVILYFAYFASFRNKRECLSLIIHSMRILAVVGILFTLTFPDLGAPVYLDGTALRGIFDHKSRFGIMLAVLFNLLIFTNNGRRKRYFYAELALVGTLLLSTQSMTGLAMALMFVTSRFVSARVLTIEGGAARLSLIGSASIAGMLALLIGYGSLLTLAGKDLSLTGRVPIWIESLELGSERTLTGHGYKALIKDEGLGYQISMRKQLNKLVPHPHSSFVAAFLDFGIFGAIFFAAHTVSKIASSFSAMIRSGGMARTNRFSFLLTLGTLGLVESELLYHTGVYYGIFMLIAYEGVTRIQRPQKRQMAKLADNNSPKIDIVLA